MTHRHALSLLEDLVDDELPPHVVEELRQKIAGDPELQREIARSRRLKELLKKIQVPDPGEQYWDETTSLILARTVEAENARISSSGERLSLVRALFSVAASIVILISALYVGSNGRTPMRLEKAGKQVVFAAASVQPQLAPSNFPAYGQKEALQIARAMVVMGPPGMLGKCLLFPDRDDNTIAGPST